MCESQELEARHLVYGLRPAEKPPAHGFLTCHNTSNCESHSRGCNANYYIAESSSHAMGFVSSFISVPSIIRKAPYTSHRKMASDTTNLCTIIIFFFFQIYLRIKISGLRKKVFRFLLFCLILSFLTRMATRQKMLSFITISYDKC